jgi:hypothetical protein
MQSCSSACAEYQVKDAIGYDGVSELKNALLNTFQSNM